MKQIRSIALSFCALALLCVSSVAQAHIPQQPKTMYDRIASHYVQAKNFTTPYKPAIYDTALEAKLGHIRSRGIAFNIFAAYTKESFLPEHKTTLSSTLWEDLELFANKSTQSDTNVFAKINRARTIVGEVKLANMVGNPTTDTALITKRQEITREILENEELFKTLDRELLNFRMTERSHLGFWDYNNAFHGEVQGKLFYPTLPLINKLNDSPFGYDAINFKLKLAKIFGTVKTWQAFFDIKRLLESRVQPAQNEIKNVGWLDAAYWKSWVDAAYWQLKASEFAESLDLDVAGKLLSGESVSTSPSYQLTLHMGSMVQSGYFTFLAGQSEWSQVTIAQQTQKLLIHLSQNLETIKAIQKIALSNAVLRENIPALRNAPAILALLERKHTKIKNLIALLNRRTFTKGGASFFSSTGNIVATYRAMIQCVELLEPALESIGEIDAYMSIARLMKEHAGLPARFSFVSFTKQDTPYVTMHNFWHPFIEPTEAITNSVTLGAHGNPQNAIVTGVNMGGKSTCLKAMTINLLLAQTLGIVTGTAAEMTPFKTINVYLNIADDLANKESTFSQETTRMHELIKHIKGLKAGEFSFVMCDEIFKGTRPKEGGAIAYTIAEYLGTIPHNITLVATHFYDLTELAQTNPDRFVNYQIRSEETADGSIVHTHKLEPGICEENIAIKILASKGHAPEIVQKAMQRLQAQAAAAA